MTDWLVPGARVRDLRNGYGNGPFSNFLGVVLHVNVDETGTPIDFWGPGNPGSVTPNFQVFKDGSVDQMFPFDWQPWCQVDGNFNYAAIESAGLPSEPYTDAQMQSIAKILSIYHIEMGMPLEIANAPGQSGLGIHSMGGTAWGGHSCPGDIRAAQRQEILNLVTGNAPTPTPSKDDKMISGQIEVSGEGSDILIPLPGLAGGLLLAVDTPSSVRVAVGQGGNAWRGWNGGAIQDNGTYIPYGSRISMQLVAKDAVVRLTQKGIAPVGYLITFA